MVAFGSAVCVLGVAIPAVLFDVVVRSNRRPARVLLVQTRAGLAGALAWGLTWCVKCAWGSGPAVCVRLSEAPSQPSPPPPPHRPARTPPALAAVTRIQPLPAVCACLHVE